MTPIASRPGKTAPSTDEAGFTLTELVAGLLVASMLMVGLVDLTRRYASTSVRVKDAIAVTHDARLSQALLSDLERIDPGSLDLGPDHLDAKIDGNAIAARLTTDATGHSRLVWSSPTLTRTITVPRGARLEHAPGGAIMLHGAPGDPPLAIIIPARALPLNCQFDTITRDCR